MNMLVVGSEQSRCEFPPEPRHAHADLQLAPQPSSARITGSGTTLTTNLMSTQTARFT